MIPAGSGNHPPRINLFFPRDQKVGHPSDLKTTAGLPTFHFQVNAASAEPAQRWRTYQRRFEYVRPQGAYYVFPRVIADHEDSREFSLRLLNEARVTVTPGSAFGPSGEHHVRMAFCVDEDVIDSAFDRIERYIPG